MTYDEAAELLLVHAYAHPNADHSGMGTGFLGMLRPYRGLQERNFHEVMQALQAVAPQLQTGPSVDRQLISALWGLCHYARAWALEPEGMLQRNHLIHDTDQARLADWLNIISDTVSNLLEGAADAVAFEAYRLHLEDSADE